MTKRPIQIIFRLSPVIFVCAAAVTWFNDVQQSGPWVVRNYLPLAILLGLALVTLVRGNGSWVGRGWQMPLGVVGYAIPALGLAAYLHYAYSVNLDGMFDGGPGELFRFLPVYTVVAGAIGFAIGWIVGRNVL
ncbi:MAG: hypothetical protein HKN77_07415 [Woeseiaceae bacterium]|nr:hypothetical protein [Woeseiaceae bacterium]